MRRAATTFVLVFITWLVLTFSLHPEEVAAGIVVSLAIAVICRHLLAKDTPRVILHPASWFWFAVYVAFMLWMEVRAHADMTRRIITGNVRPAIVEVPVEFKSLLGKTLLGNSITMVPGTLTVNTGDDKRFFVHAIGYSKKGEEIEKPFYRFGSRVIK